MIAASPSCDGARCCCCCCCALLKHARTHTRTHAHTRDGLPCCCANLTHTHTRTHVHKHRVVALTSHTHIYMHIHTNMHIQTSKNTHAQAHTEHAYLKVVACHHHEGLAGGPLRCKDGQERRQCVRSLRDRVLFLPLQAAGKAAVAAAAVGKNTRGAHT